MTDLETTIATAKAREVDAVRRVQAQIAELAPYAEAVDSLPGAQLLGCDGCGEPTTYADACTTTTATWCDACRLANCLTPWCDDCEDRRRDAEYDMRRKQRGEES